MASELLSLCIPTRNRARWLEIALTVLAKDVQKHHISPDVFKIYISDNCATDDTPAVVKRFQEQMPGLIYSRNETNIGGDRNILHCPELAKGQYVWIMGDDDSVIPGRLPFILDVLSKNRLALFLNLGVQSAPGFKLPAHFKNFRGFAQACSQVNPQTLLSHSLISANIFRAECFDLKLAHERIKTFYGHMYAMVDRMDDNAGGVYVPNRATIKIRNSSTDPIDGIWPPNLETSWRDYLAWLKEKFDLKELDPTKVNAYVRLAVFHEFKAHPFRSAWHYSAFLKHKQTYKTAWRLLTKS